MLASSTAMRRRWLAEVQEQCSSWRWWRRWLFAAGFYLANASFDCELRPRLLHPTRKGMSSSHLSRAITSLVLALVLARGGSGLVKPSLVLRGGGVSGRGSNGSLAGRRAATSRGNDVPTYARNAPRDGVLYDELEVHYGATGREIKKAYYKLAVLHHPDKKPGDVSAEERFKRVSEAYQILQDEKLRERYHKKGMTALDDDGTDWGTGGDRGAGNSAGGGRAGRPGERKQNIDPMEVFRMFLGGGVFEHLIGPLSPRMVPEEDPDYHYQKARVLAEELEKRLEVHVRGNWYWFDQAAWSEALQLRDRSLGRQILRTVGYVYRNYALRSLGKLAPNVLQPQAIRGKLKYVSDQAHRMNNLLAAVSSTTRLYVHLQTSARKPEVYEYGKLGDEVAEQRQAAQEEETAAIVMQTLWRVHRVDVEHTVQRACKMVLRDPRMPPSVLKLRAKALMRLAHIFTSAAKGKDPEPGVFQFVENAAAEAEAAAAAAAVGSDPMAGTATGYSSSSWSDSQSAESNNDYTQTTGDGWESTWHTDNGQHSQQDAAWASTPPMSTEPSFGGYDDIDSRPHNLNERIQDTWVTSGFDNDGGVRRSGDGVPQKDGSGNVVRGHANSEVRGEGESDGVQGSKTERGGDSGIEHDTDGSFARSHLSKDAGYLDGSRNSRIVRDESKERNGHNEARSRAQETTGYLGFVPQVASVAAPPPHAYHAVEEDGASVNDVQQVGSAEPVAVESGSSHVDRLKSRARVKKVVRSLGENEWVDTEEAWVDARRRVSRGADVMRGVVGQREWKQPWPREGETYDWLE